MTLKISLNDHSMVMKYITNLHVQINIKLSLFETYDITMANMMVVMIEKKNQTRTKKNMEKAKRKHQKAKEEH